MSLLLHLVQPVSCVWTSPTQRSWCCCKLEQTNGSLFSAVSAHLILPMFHIQPTTASVKTEWDAVAGEGEGPTGSLMELYFGGVSVSAC